MPETLIECVRAEVAAAFAEAGLDARVEIEQFETLTVDQLRDELVYLGDYQC